MKKSLPIVMCVAVAFAPLVAKAADEDSRVTQIVTNVCSNCHGQTGNSVSPIFPRLNGQKAEYLEDQLKAFRDHSRADPHATAYMWGITQTLDDAAITGLAKYFAAQKPTPAAPDGSAAAILGKKIFADGAGNGTVPACATCHGPAGGGNGEFPRLAGQHRSYLIKQMEAFRSLLRASEVMHANTQNMTNEQILAVAAFIGAN